MSKIAANFQTRRAECGVDTAQYQPKWSHFILLKGWNAANAHNLGLLTGGNAREFSNSRAGRWNACEFSNSPDGRWGGPSPVATGMLTELVYLQDGMPAKFQNRKLDDGMGLERTNKRTNEQTRLRAVNSTKILRGQSRHQQTLCFTLVY